MIDLLPPHKDSDQIHPNSALPLYQQYPQLRLLRYYNCHHMGNTTYIPYSRKVWRGECLVNLLSRAFGEKSLANE